ncbi:hypothetical protein CPB83DRAFT_900926 [Crepidotus variabilis]|uniref:Uncharacterized protein n=1 Tax=Crepidotus variabilis TaxID=179855 RepID=A0A9P6E2T6_9AGAR|nr:hypothetical protein CPB83DRAFT_900926 [Crepidotus variabilis]
MDRKSPTKSNIVQPTGPLEVHNSLFNVVNGNTVVYGGNYYMYNHTYQISSPDSVQRVVPSGTQINPIEGPIIPLQLCLSADQRSEIRRMKDDVQRQHNLSANNAFPSMKVDLPTSYLSPLLPGSPTLDPLVYQVNKISKEVSTLAVDKSTVTVTRHKLLESFVMRVNPFHSFRCSPQKRRRALLREALCLLDDIEDNADAIAEHASALSILGEHLHALRMESEANTIYTWAVDLYRALANIQPDIFLPYLADSLLNIGFRVTQNTPATEEAVALLRPISGPECSPDIRCHFANALTWHASYLSDTLELHEEALKLQKEAVSIYESVLRQEAQFANLVENIHRPTNCRTSTR